MRVKVSIIEITPSLASAAPTARRESRPHRAEKGNANAERKFSAMLTFGVGERALRSCKSALIRRCVWKMSVVVTVKPSAEEIPFGRVFRVACHRQQFSRLEEKQSSHPSVFPTQLSRKESRVSFCVSFVTSRARASLVTTSSNLYFVFASHLPFIPL